jgi:hypothetical protein
VSHHFLFSLTPELRSRFKGAAGTSGLTMQRYLEGALTHYIETTEERKKAFLDAKLRALEVANEKARQVQIAWERRNPKEAARLGIGDAKTPRRKR